MKHIFFLFLTTLAFLACTSPEPPKKYVFDCYARFDEQSGKMTAEASLNEGALTPKPVDPPGGIRYQKVDMTLVPMMGLKYQHEYPADFTKEHLFEWKTLDGKPLEFTLQMASLDSISFESKVLSRRKPAKFSWTGPSLERGEALVFIWENTTLGKTVPIELYNIGSSKTNEFPAVKMAEIPAGNWTYYVVRKKLQKATVEGVAVNGVTEYYSIPQAVKITE
jgi:hypothetical protein